MVRRNTVPQTGPLEKTFELLASWPGTPSANCIKAALSEPTPEIQRLALKAVFKKGDRLLSTAAIESWNLLPREFQLEVVRQYNSLMSALRQLLDHPSVQVRRNTISILAEACQAKLTYLYIKALNDADMVVTESGGDALMMITADFHLARTAVQRRLLNISRSEMEVRKYSVIDPLATALKTPAQKNKKLLIQVAIGLDPSLDALLMRLLAEPNDERARALLEVLWSDAGHRTIHFLLGLLEKPRLTRVALRVIGKRIDGEFIHTLLEQDELFNADGTSALAHLKQIEWLKPEHGIIGGLSARQALMALQVIVLSGIEPAEKLRLIVSLKSYHNKPVGQVCDMAIKLLTGRVPSGGVVEEIRIRIADSFPPAIHDHLGSVPIPLVKPQQPGLSIDPVNADILRQVECNRVSYQDFIDNFDKLHPTLRRRAARTLAKMDPTFPLKLLAELGSDDSTQRIKGLKLVEMLDMVMDYRRDVEKMLNDLDSRIRATAAKLTGKITDDETTKSLLQLVMDHDYRVCANAIEALAENGTSEMEHLLRLLSRHSDNRIKTNAIVALFRLGFKDAVGLLRQMLDHDDRKMRISALWAVKELKLTDTGERIMKMATGDPDQEVRERARQVVHVIAPRMQETR